MGCQVICNSDPRGKWEEELTEQRHAKGGTWAPLSAGHFELHTSAISGSKAIEESSTRKEYFLNN